MNRISVLVPAFFLCFPGVLAAQEKGPPDKGQDKAQGKEPAASKIDFQKQVLPIFEKKCSECHSSPSTDAGGKAKKPKGGVIVDTKDGILASKKGKFVVAKKPDESKLVDVITQPADSDDRMPPKNKKEALPKDEVETLKKWVEQGAEFGTWTGKKDAKPGDKPKPGDTPKPADKKEGDKPKPPEGGKKGG
jgi:uncharacterized membrane protein